MKNFTFIAAAALVVGLGFGFSKPAEARITVCDNPNYSGCMAECTSNDTPYRICRNFCCIG